MSEWYIDPCDRCGGAIRHGERMVDTAGWSHKDPATCRAIIEADIRKKVAAEVLLLDPWVVLGYSNLALYPLTFPDERLAQAVIGDIADRITRVTP